MTSIICPKCGNHISEWDLVCLNCDFVITPEERVRLKTEHEKLISRDSNGKDHIHVRPRKHPIQRKLNTISFGVFKVGWPEMVVPVIAVVLIALVIFFMLI
ncbi:MAG: hypothetical protein C0397_06510 [Odoribacter sp.]|nr:hypothetical protein [Odoribacter sp.]